MKRLISALIALIMLFAVLVLPSAAEDNVNYEDTSAESEVTEASEDSQGSQGLTLFNISDKTYWILFALVLGVILLATYNVKRKK